MGGAAPQPDGTSPWRSLAGTPGPVFLESAAQIVRLCDTDINAQASSIGGWHGTSLEAIEHALRLGALAPSALPYGQGEVGYLFYYPVQSVDFDPNLDLLRQSNGRGGALYYAATSAANHYLITRCRLDFTNEDHHILAMELFDSIQSDPRARCARDTLSERGIPESRQHQIVREARGRKGFLIAISRAALEEWKPSEGDQAGVDEKIFVPGGLPFRYISAMKPLGPIETSFVDVLRSLIRRERGE